jgi:hypothetical protein
MGSDLAPAQTLAFEATSRRVFIGITISILTSKLSGRECQGHDNANCKHRRHGQTAVQSMRYSQLTELV